MFLSHLTTISDFFMSRGADINWFEKAVNSITTKETHFCKTSFQVGVDMKKLQKQGHGNEMNGFSDIWKLLKHAGGLCLFL